jgi:hypothetical protein
MDFVKIPTQSKKFNFQFTPEAELRGNNFRNFVFAGNALFTVLNEETGNYVTFKVKKHKEDDVWFVNTLSGHNYVHIGTCFSDKKFKVKNGGVLDAGDQKVKVFTWLLDTFFNNQEKYPKVKVYHHGRCGACYKTLTTPESIKSGIGPICGGGRVKK